MAADTIETRVARGGVGVLYEAADVIAERGQPTKGQACSGVHAAPDEPVCLVCVLCVAAGGRPGVLTEDAKDAMWLLAGHLGLKLPGDVWNWYSSRARAGWYIADVLRAAARRGGA